MFPRYPDLQVQHQVLDDFDRLDTVSTTGLWQAVKGTGGTVALQDAANGWINVPTAASANDYQLLATQKKVFKFAAGKPLYFEALVSCTEAAVNQANLVFGLSSITTTGILLTGSGGLPTSFDGALIWKQGGTSKWQFTSSVGTAQVNNSSVADFASATPTRIGFMFDPGNGVVGRLTCFVNGVAPMNGPVLRSHVINYGGTGALYGVFGVNAGSAAAETVSLDYFRIVQAR